MKEKRYKYIHLIRNSEIFGTRLAEMISNPENDLDSIQHLYVVTSKECYDAIIQYSSEVELYTGDVSDVALICYYGDRGEWIFAHGLATIFGVHKIPRKYRRKLIWRTWGHDVPSSSSGSFLVQHVKKCSIRLYSMLFVRSFRAVGINNSADEVSLAEIGIQNRLFLLGYPQRREFARSISNANQTREVLNVMVGHSALETDDHFTVIDLLKNLSKSGNTFYFPISYGDYSLADRIKTYAKQELGEDKCVFIEEKMSFDAYDELLNRMDVAFFAGMRSYALGNVEILLRNGKTLYFHKGSILAKAFEREKIPFCYIEELLEIDPQQHLRQLVYFPQKEWTMVEQEYEYYVAGWKKCLEEL